MKNKNIFQSFKHAFEGLVYALWHERNLKIHFTAIALVVLFGFYYQINYLEWIGLLLTIALVVGFELLNTAMEEIVDLLMPEYSEVAKKAKDIAAGAVLFMAIVSVLVGLIIFVPKIW